MCTNVNPHPTGETGLLSGLAKLRLAATARCPQCRIKNGHGCDGLRMHLVRSRSWLNCNRDVDGMRTEEGWRGGGGSTRGSRRSGSNLLRAVVADYAASCRAREGETRVAQG